VTTLTTRFHFHSVWQLGELTLHRFPVKHTGTLSNEMQCRDRV